MEKLLFQPTKTWIKNHKDRPEECPDKDCHCILDHINKHSCGFCVGIFLGGDDLDIISFCNNTYDLETHQSEARRYLWHPNEAHLIATYISYAVLNAWTMLPNHRKQLGYMNRKRTRLLNKKDGIE